MAHVEPMDLDGIDSDFDNKENTYQHNNALPRMSCIDNGYEELDASELSMKLRYAVTPTSSPMSKSYTANCIDNRNISSVEDVLFTNNQNLTRSLNSTITNSESIVKSPKSLPLQSISTDQFNDLNRSSSIRRSLDAGKNNVTVTISAPQDLDDNLSLPSTSSSLINTPEATTPTKEIPKNDGGSPIMRGLKSVLSMFRSSQSPIPPSDEPNLEKKDISPSEPEVKDPKPQTVLASTPLRSKHSPLKNGSPLKESVVFKEDLERELQWKDDSTIIFKDDKIPIHKLFPQPLPEIKAIQNLKNENINNSVEYMDISLNDSAVNESVKNFINNDIANNTVESDGEFQDCETTLTKIEQNEEVRTDNTFKCNTECSQDDINMSIVEHEVEVDQPAILLPVENINTTIDIHSSGTEVESHENIISQHIPEDIKLNSTINIETDSKLPVMGLHSSGIDVKTDENNISQAQSIKEDIKFNSTIEKDLMSSAMGLHSSAKDMKTDENNMSQVQSIPEDIKLNSTVNIEKDSLLSDVGLNPSGTEVKIDADNVSQDHSVLEDIKINSTINIEDLKLPVVALPDIVENINNQNMPDMNIKQDELSCAISTNTTNNAVHTYTDLENNSCEQLVLENKSVTLNECMANNAETNIAMNELQSSHISEDNKNSTNINCNQDDINMSIVENEHTDINLEESSVSSQNQLVLNANQTFDQINQPPFEETVEQNQLKLDDLKLDETMNIETNSQSLNVILPDIVENIKNFTETKAEENHLMDVPCDTSEIILPTEVNKNHEQHLSEDKSDIINNIVEVANCENNLDNLQEDILVAENVVENTHEVDQSLKLVNETINRTVHKEEENIDILELEQKEFVNSDHEVVVCTSQNLNSESQSNSNIQEDVETVCESFNILSNPVENKDNGTIEIHFHGNALLKETQFEQIISNMETSKNNELDVNKACEIPNELNQDISDLGNLQYHLNETAVISHEQSTEPFISQDENVNIMQSDGEFYMDVSLGNSKPSDIPLPFDDDIMSSIEKDETSTTADHENKKLMIEINSVGDSTKSDTESSVPHNESNKNDNCEKALNEDDEANKEKVDEANIVNGPIISVPETAVKGEDENKLEVTSNRISGTDSINLNSEDSKNSRSQMEINIQTGDCDISMEKEIIVESQNCINTEMEQHVAQHDVNSTFDVNTTITDLNEHKETLINDSSIPLAQQKQEEVILEAENSPSCLDVDMEVDNINHPSRLSEQNPFETQYKVASTPPHSPAITSKGYNFNFDEMDDPFATKTKIRQSPPLEGIPNDTFKPINESGKRTSNSLKKTNQNRRKSEPVPRNKVVSKKSFNSTFDFTVTTKEQTDKCIVNDSVLNNNLTKEDNKVNNSEESDAILKELEKTRDVNDTDVNVNNTYIHNEDDNKIKENEEDNKVCKASDTIPIEASRKNVFNLPEIDDKNFNPFATRSKICVSATNDNNSTIHNNSDNFEVCNSTITQVSQEAEIDANEKVNLSNISTVTSSSKHTDEKNDTVKEVHTEDEDTIEGPFLEAEDFVDFDKDTDVLPASDGNDMMGFEDFPTQPNEENADNAEIFIDAEAFEFLLNQNKSNVVADSGKESLFLKFDPLFAKRVSSDGILAALNKVPKRVSTPKKTPQNVDKKILTDDFSAGPSSKSAPTPDIVDDINMNVTKPTMIVNPAVNSVISPRKAATPPKINRQSLTFTSPAMAVIDRLLSLSGNANSSFLNHDTTMPQVSAEQHQTDSALIQLREMLAEKEIHVQTLRSESKELRERLTVMESQVKSLEDEGYDRLKKITELNEKLSEKIKVNKTMSTVVEEYERTIASLVSELEQDKRRNAEERMKLIRDRDEQTAHLASMEVSFSDLHSKYEKSKQIIFSLKANEDTYKKSVKEFEENLVKMQNNYELLKQHATSKLNHANSELEKMNRAHEAEVLKLNAMIKRKDLHITSLEETLAQKTKANEELTAICDELINKVG